MPFIGSLNNEYSTTFLDIYDSSIIAKSIQDQVCMTNYVIINRKIIIYIYFFLLHMIENEKFCCLIKEKQK